MKPSVKCNICEKKFKNIKSMTNHRRWHNLIQYKKFQKDWKSKSKEFSEKTQFKDNHNLWDNKDIKDKMIGNISNSKNNNYIDGRTKKGYFRYKFITINKKLILEHRYLMEQKLGRRLNNREVVDHIDGNPKNNDIDNLRLFSNQSEHIKFHRNGGEEDFTK